MSLHLDSQLLEALFETISTEVHVFEAVRDPDDIITGFRSLRGNKATDAANGKLARDLFDEFVNVIETGQLLDMILQHKEKSQNKWYHVKARKFNNGLIVYREDITIAKHAEEKIKDAKSNRVIFSFIGRFYAPKNNSFSQTGIRDLPSN